MAGSSFCAFMEGLRAAAPALPPSDVPHLYNFSQLARCFPVQPQARAFSEQPQPQAQERAASEQLHAKANAEQPQAQDDSAAQPLVNGHEADEEERSESKADSEVMSVDGRAESVKSDAKPEFKAELSAASRADAKATPKGSRPSSRGPSSDGAVDPKAGKAVPKVASRVSADSNKAILAATQRPSDHNTCPVISCYELRTRLCLCSQQPSHVHASVHSSHHICQMQLHLLLARQAAKPDMPFVHAPSQQHCFLFVP